jgi:hypothetical protein
MMAPFYLIPNLRNTHLVSSVLRIMDLYAPPLDVVIALSPLIGRN